MRLFIAVNLPENIRKKLYEEAEQLKKEGLFEGKITEKENIHLTLKFLGELEDEKIEEIIKKLEEVKAKKRDALLGNLGVFDEKFVRIIWVKMLGVEDLQKEIDRNLRGLFNEEERFMSHITLVRVKNVKEKKDLIDKIKKIRLDNLKFKVESFELIKSELSKEGPKYEIIKKFQLV